MQVLLVSGRKEDEAIKEEIVLALDATVMDVPRIQARATGLGGFGLLVFRLNELTREEVLAVQVFQRHYHCPIICYYDGTVTLAFECLLQLQTNEQIPVVNVHGHPTAWRERLNSVLVAIVPTASSFAALKS